MVQIRSSTEVIILRLVKNYGQVKMTMDLEFLSLSYHQPFGQGNGLSENERNSEH